MFNLSETHELFLYFLKLSCANKQVIIDFINSTVGFFEDKSKLNSSNNKVLNKFITCIKNHSYMYAYFEMLKIRPE